MSTELIAPRKPLTLIEELLAEQQRLDTPVARFSRDAERRPEPRVESRYRDLIPLTGPRPGEQYAFEVELDACTGCKACVAACHSLNGLDDTETWRDIGLLIGGDQRQPFTQTVTSACHHCADPACLNGCPVLAYEKDPVTGIVRHLDDQCIGCQYCVLKCPYDAPKYNERLGIVRKCDLCHNRLAEGEAPACVQACPTQAIRIVSVAVPAPGKAGGAEPAQFLAGLPAADYTRPTTRYVSRQTPPENAAAADAATLRPQPPHWPLILLLTFLPMAVGCLAAAAWLPDAARVHGLEPLVLAAWLCGGAGIVASVCHLGQPLRAWRIFLGWRKSWLSREALFLGPWFGAVTAALWAPRGVPAVAGLGIAALGCSVMVYVDTRRRAWRFSQTAPRFFGTAAVLGLAARLALRPPSAAVAALLIGVTLVKLMVELQALRPQRENDGSVAAFEQTARLLRGPFRWWLGARLAAALLGGVLLPALAGGRMPPWIAFGALGLCVAGELMERLLFFRTVDAPKMPGVPA